MNPLLQAALSSILRWLLAFVAGYLVRAGIWTGSEAEAYVAAAALAILSLAWARRDDLRNRVKLLVALLPGIRTEDDVNAHLQANRPTPPLTTPSNTPPAIRETV